MKHHHTLFVSRIYLRLIIAVLLSSPFSVSAQEETAFPNEYATWEVGYIWMNFPPDGPWSTYIEHFEAFPLNTDTLIMLFDDGVWLGNYYSTADKVYFNFVSNNRPFNFQSEVVDTGVYHLLYDFTLEVDDTAYTDQVGSYVYYITVDSITMEDVDGDMLKHFHLSNSDIIVEKIGSLQGLFRPYSRSFEINQSLCSYNGSSVTENLGTAYSYSIENCLPSVLGLETNEMNAVIAYPNPANDKLTITTELPVWEYHLYSAAGTVVEIPHVMQENKLELVVSGLPSGIYFLELKDHSGNSKMLHFIRN
ncbi:T9SS type A sorting domain-containing protein [Fluviicola taffensis]|uniref:T9SS type A sorting domain-containing protein n=1 Tax=Fluviicola taffensis TaxID=191579 RepID=UPI0031380923